jgi:ribonucleotide monophosphatase NagD (HAD superfamily)
MWIGDTLETDIAGAAAAGAIGVLVLTGNTPPASRYRPRPALVVPDLMTVDAMLREAVEAGPVG